MNQPSQQGRMCKSFPFSIFFPSFKSKEMGHEEKKKYSILQFVFNCYTGRTGAEM